jgi:hypothetical protein
MSTWSSVTLAIGTVSTAVVVAAVTGCGDVPAGATATADRAAAATATRTAAVPAASPPPGDLAPHEVENNAWKQRGEPTAGDRAAARSAAERIRRAAERRRPTGALSPAATRDMLLRLGFAGGRVAVAAPRGRDGATPAGAVFAVHVGRTACVVGALSPDRTQVEVTGRAAEYGCLEPFSH